MLRSLSSVLLAASCALLPACSPVPDPAMAELEALEQALATSSGHGAGRFQLELHGEVAGIVKRVETRFDDATLTVNLAYSAEVHAWLDRVLDKRVIEHDVAIVQLDADGAIVAETRLDQALVTDLGFADLGSEAEEPPAVTIKLQPGGVVPVAPEALESAE